MYNDLIEGVDMDLYRIIYVVKKNGSFSNHLMQFQKAIFIKN